jgi:hypothetical protein
MDHPILTPPNLDDETVVKLNDFFYELLEAFESHYGYQILRYQRELRAQRMQSKVESLFEDEDEAPF